MPRNTWQDKLSVWLLRVGAETPSATLTWPRVGHRHSAAETLTALCEECGQLAACGIGAVTTQFPGQPWPRAEPGGGPEPGHFHPALMSLGST